MGVSVKKKIGKMGQIMRTTAGFAKSCAKRRVLDAAFLTFTGLAAVNSADPGFNAV